MLQLSNLLAWSVALLRKHCMQILWGRQNNKERVSHQTLDHSALELAPWALTKETS